MQHSTFKFDPHLADNGATHACCVPLKSIFYNDIQQEGMGSGDEVTLTSNSGVGEEAVQAITVSVLWGRPTVSTAALSLSSATAASLPFSFAAAFLALFFFAM